VEQEKLMGKLVNQTWSRKESSDTKLRQQADFNTTDTTMLPTDITDKQEQCLNYRGIKIKW